MTPVILATFTIYTTHDGGIHEVHHVIQATDQVSAALTATARHARTARCDPRDVQWRGER